MGGSIVDLVYPIVCVGCNEELATEGGHFCVPCKMKVAYTDHFEVKDNDLIYRIGPRAHLTHGAALFNFIKGGSVRRAVHALKYKSRPDIGLSLGREFGNKMKASSLCTLPDILIPIPLQKKKKRTRGYNQSERFAEGISQTTGIPVQSNFLVKEVELVSQTRKNREDRFESVLNSFSLKKPYKLKGKHVMIVDDVMTTGATLEAACTLMSQIPEIKIQAGIIALADE